MQLDENIIKGPIALEPLPKISLGELIYRALESATTLNENKHILIDGETKEYLTISDLFQKSRLLAQALENCGYAYTTGTIISISSENNVQWFVSLLASLFIGATIAPINHNSTPIELKHLLNLSKPKVIFCSNNVIDKFNKIKGEIPSMRIILMDTPNITSSSITDSIDSLIEKHCHNHRKISSSTIINSKINEEDTALIMCSSGTTGLPKGVMLTHKNINTVLVHLRDTRYHLKDAVPLCVLPFFHAYGLLATLSGIFNNVTTVFLKRFDPILFLKTIENYKIQKLFLAPPLLLFLAKSPLVFNYDLTSVIDVLCGAAPLKKSTENEFKKRFNVKEIRQGYGLTEATLAIMLYQLHDVKKPGSSGKPLPFMKVGIRDTKTGQFLGPNKTGEVIVKGEMVMKGYYGNAEATKNTFDENGWLLTGDIGYYDEDANFYIVDRIKELIKYKGFQVAPAEIEAVLLTHPEIEDSGVVGASSDENVGELPLAFVVKSKNSKISEKDVQVFVEGKLSSYKWLRGGVRFVDKIPKNASGKILRRELKTMVTKSKL